MSAVGSNKEENLNIELAEQILQAQLEKSTVELAHLENERMLIDNNFQLAKDAQEMEKRYLELEYQDRQKAREQEDSQHKRNWNYLLVILLIFLSVVIAGALAGYAELITHFLALASVGWGAFQFGLRRGEKKK
jgi:cation transport ATPase